MSRAPSGKAPKPPRIRAIAFDLDGTLIDSFADLATAINATRAAYGQPPLPRAEVTRHVGNGTEHLVRCTVPIPAADAEEAHRRFLLEYDRHLLDSTRPYAGVEAVLDRLGGCFLALVTNKPLRQTGAILAGLGWSGRFRLVLGGDSLPAKKPDPLPLKVFLERARSSPREAAIVGDSSVDIQAGKAAGLWTIAVAGGNTTPEALSAQQPDWLLDDLAGLPDLIG